MTLRAVLEFLGVVALVIVTAPIFAWMMHAVRRFGGADERDRERERDRPWWS